MIPTFDARVAYLKKLQATIDSDRIESSIEPDLLKPESIQDPERLRERLADLENKDSVLSRAASIQNRTCGHQIKNLRIFNHPKRLDKKEIFQYIRSEFQERIPGQLSDLNNLVLEISLLQALARSNSIEVIDVSIDSKQAIEIARCMRRDWMNARASHVDNWRNIEFVADQLEAQVDLVLKVTLATTATTRSNFVMKRASFAQVSGSTRRSLDWLNGTITGPHWLTTNKADVSSINSKTT